MAFVGGLGANPEKFFFAEDDAVLTAGKPEPEPPED
jgi:hypothetical protein